MIKESINVKFLDTGWNEQNLSMIQPIKATRFYVLLDSERKVHLIMKKGISKWFYAVCMIILTSQMQLIRRLIKDPNS